MNIKSTNEQLLRNYGAYKNNQLEQSNTIKNSDTIEITKDKIVSKKVSNDNYLKLGDNGSEISQLQTLLKKSGHLKSAVNGYYGKETEDAVKSFQRQRGLEETGVIDLTTKVAIAESRDVAKSSVYSTVAEAPMRRAKRSVAIEHSAGGSSQGGMDVYYLQVLCNQYGISVNTDGIWGTNTEKAVRQLPQLSYGSNEGAVYHVQNVLKIPADGQFGSTTKAAVENWQRQHGLTADGIVGADTWVSFSGCKPISNSSNLMMVGSKGDNVRTAQMKLIFMGYNCGTSGADGDYGSGTADAVRAFQGDYGLSKDGIIGDETLSKINFEYGWRKRQDDWAIQPDDPIAIENKKKLDDSMLFKQGDQSKHLEKYQQKLKDLGFYNGEIDGKFGSGTYNAVRAFQGSVGLSQDGVIGENTIKALNDEKISSATRLVASPTEATQWLQILCNQMGIRDGSGNSLPQNGEMTQGTVEAIKQLPVLSTSTKDSYSGAVKHIQNLLKITADGYYGSNTESAVRIWQSAHGISADGIVGRDTWETFAGQKLVAKNGGSTTPVTPPITKPNEEEKNSLMDKIKSIPEYVDIICEDIQDNPKDFAKGILKSLDENGYGGTASWIVNKFNLGSLEGDSVSYMAGKVIGDSASTAAGVATILGGIAQEALGISADGTGVLAPVGVSLNAAGALTISYGATVTTVSSKRGMEDAGKLFEKCEKVNGTFIQDGNVNIPKSVSRKAKKLSPEAKRGYDKAIEALKSGDVRGLNEHPLTGNRKGQWAVDVKGTGGGRGAGRIVYEKRNGSINIVELITDHEY